MLKNYFNHIRLVNKADNLTLNAFNQSVRDFDRFIGQLQQMERMQRPWGP